MSLHIMLLGLLASTALALPTAQTRLTVQGGTYDGTISSLLWTGWTETNSRVWAGGAIHFDTTQQASITISSCDFVNCWNGWEGGEKQQCPDGCKGGGAIYTNQIALVCDNCRFTACKTVSGRGGGILANENSQATITLCHFTNCEAAGEECSQVSGGGAVASNSRNLVIKRCQFHGCNCSYFGGGAVYAFGGIDCELSEFTNCVGGNNESLSGGAIWAKGDGDSRVFDCDFTTCSAYTVGAVYYSGTGSFNISVCTFDHCTAEKSPSCLFIDAPEQAFKSLIFKVDLTSTLMKIETFQGPYNIVDFEVDGNIADLEEDQWLALPNDRADITIKDSSFSNFKKNAASGGGVFQFASTQGRSVVVSDCYFKNVNVHNGNGGVFCFKYPGKEDAVITGCTFERCTSTGPGGALYFEFTSKTEGGCQITNCTFVRNNGGGSLPDGQNLYIVFQTEIDSPDKYVVKNCTFRDNTRGGAFAIKPQPGSQEFTFPWTLSDLVFESCQLSENFDLVHIWSSGEVVYEDCRFEGITASQYGKGGVIALCSSSPTENRTVKLVRCRFEDCATISNGILYSTNGVDLTLDNCHFILCSSSGSSSILSKEDACMALTVNNCEFTQCTGTGPVFGLDSGSAEFVKCDFVECENNDWNGGTEGQIFFSENFKDTAVITGCTFKRNSASSGAQDIRAVLTSGLSRFRISDCEFCENSDAAITLSGSYGTERIDEEWTLDSCNFTDGRGIEEGVIAVWAHVTFNNCQFIRITGENYGGIFPVTMDDSHCKYYHFNDCIFQDNTDDVGLIVVTWRFTVDLLVISGCTFERITGPAIYFEADPQRIESNLDLRNCSFTECSASGSIFYVSGIGEVKVSGCQFSDCHSEEIVVDLSCNYIEFHSNTFNISTTNAITQRYVVIKCENASLSNNDFLDTSGLTEPPLLLEVNSGSSTFNGTLFTVAESSPLLFDLVCGANSELAFYNCCFTHSGGPRDSPYFMRINNSGKVTFADVCFDADRKSSIEINGNDVVFLDEDPASSFGNCSCWVLPPPEPTPTEIPPGPEPTETPEHGGGGHLGGKEIAGIVVGCVVAVGVIAAIIILLVIRRKKQGQHSDTTTATIDPEEETVTTLTDNMDYGAWSQVTEENPTASVGGADAPFQNTHVEDADE